MTDTKTQTTLVLGGTGKTRDFAFYARDAGASGVWDVPAANGADQ
jgi:hypothetical protein